MPIEITNAIPEQAADIAIVLRFAFNEAIQLSQIESCLRSGKHRTVVALDGGKVVGLSDGFVTIAKDGTRRLELDLQAVHPDYQGQGIGKRLITQFSEIDAGQSVVRALVDINNIHMQKAMRATGFTSNKIAHNLYISTSATTGATPLPASAHLIPVETLSYSGYWLEGTINSQSAQVASTYHSDNHIVGCLVPVSDSEAITALDQAGFQFIKPFHWWAKSS